MLTEAQKRASHNWYIKNKEQKKKQVRKWQNEHLSQFKENQKKNRYKRLMKMKNIRLQLIQKLGGKCKCGFSDIRALQIDYKKGGHSKISKHYAEQYMKLIKHTNLDDWQVLCANCNWIKRYENNEIKLVYI